VTVNTRPVTVTADPQTKVYGDPDPALTYQITSGSLVFADTFTGSLTRGPGEDVGTYAILQGTLALPASYNLTYVGDDLTITKADSTCTVTPYDVTYDGTPHTATGVCEGVMAEPLEGLDLSSTTHIDTGVYTDPWTFNDVTGNYNDANGTVEDNISQADATCVVTPYDVTYDGDPHTATGECTGVMDEPLEGLDLSVTTHTNVGVYTDPWSFTDVSGNYNDANGTVVDNIRKTEPSCEVTAYTVEYDAVAHTAPGSCLGVDGNPLAGLDLSGTTHTDIATYAADPWVFSDVTGNYTDANGTVDDKITLRAVTVVADAKSKAIGLPDPALTYKITVGSLLWWDYFIGNLTRQPGEQIGTYAILQGTLSLPAYYDLTIVESTFTITNLRLLLPLMYRMP
jgi:hypothetical protein